MDESALEFHELTERQRLEECVREPIRTPGRIQSHGILLVVDAISNVITAASENAAAWIGRRVVDIGSPTLEWCITSGTHTDPVRVEFAGGAYDAIVHTVADQAIVELEPELSALEFPRTSVIGAIQRLSLLTDVAAIRRTAVQVVREVSGFDRVMMYSFAEDGHGEVVGESHAEDMDDAYLGLHFPASDIPAQARALYLTKLSRAIISTSDPGTPILAADGEIAGRLDLSGAELRAVSPHHLEFMRNMGQASTVSLSMIHEGRLIGMITCAHRTERRIPILLRRALEVLASQLTLQIVSLESIARLSRTLLMRERRSALLAPLTASGDVLRTLLDGRETVRGLIPAEGVLARIDGALRASGDVPDGDRSALLAALGDAPLALSELPTSRPDLAALMPGFAGILLVPLTGEDRLVFFRREVGHVVRWMGDLGEGNRPDPLSPRRSFAEWKQSVSGTSHPWGDAVADAEELGREVAQVLERRAESRLAELALIDPLTGLHNRRHLVDQIEASLETSTRDAIVFLDLDHFKEVNDTRGHEAGDVVLTAIAERLQAGSRASDVVARLGGDEFVVLCLDTTEEEAVVIAERLLAAIVAPISVSGGTVAVSASAGIARVTPGATVFEILDSADTAMYRAKHAGRHRVSR